MLNTFDEPMSLTNLPVEAILRIDIGDCASHVQAVLGEYLLPEPMGVYCAGKLEPVMVPERLYFSVVGRAESTPVVDFNDLKGNLYDENGRLVVPKLYMRTPKRYLQRDCFLPYHGLKVLEVLAQELVGEHLRYHSGRADYVHKLQGQMHPIATDEEMHEITELITDVSFSVKHEITKFLAEYHYNIFLVRLENHCLVLERYVDWRIFDWTQRMQSGEWK